MKIKLSGKPVFLFFNSFPSFESIAGSPFPAIETPGGQGNKTVGKTLLENHLFPSQASVTLVCITCQGSCH
jgi:hypothetical protein